MSTNPENPNPLNELEGNELFSIVKGKKTDAQLHEEILAVPDPVDERRQPCIEVQAVAGHPTPARERAANSVRV
jgi:hypothetical protein